MFLLKRLINLQPYEIYSTFESMYMYVHINYEKQSNRKKMYTMVGRIFVWNDTFQVDNESECFLERESYIFNSIENICFKFKKHGFIARQK